MNTSMQLPSDLIVMDDGHAQNAEAFFGHADECPENFPDACFARAIKFNRNQQHDPNYN